MPIENDKPAIVQLHQAMRDMAWGDTPTIRKAAVSAGRLLRKGVDPNGVVERQTPMNRLMTTVPQHMRAKRGLEYSKQACEGMDAVRHNERLKMFDTLLDAGADPWKGAENTWQYGQRSQLEYLLISMFQREQKGEIRRGPGGENPLHSLHWFHFLHLETYGVLQVGNCVHAHQSVAPWMMETDNSGDLPIHRLWRQASSVLPHQVDEFCHAALWATYQFCKISKGATLTVEEIPAILGARGADGATIGSLALGSEDIIPAIEREDQYEIPWRTIFESSALEVDTLAAGPGRARCRF